VRRFLLLLAPLLAALLLGAHFGCVTVSMPGHSFEGAPAPPSSEDKALRARLERDVVTLASDIGPRNHERRDALDAALQYIAARLTSAGYEPRVRAFHAAGQRFENLEVVIPGRLSPGESIVVGAHYDTASHTPGADDNASGVAALLAIAEALKDREPERTVRLVAFANEEPPFFGSDDMGSVRYANAIVDETRVVAMLSLETIGYFSEESGSQQYPFPFDLFYPSRGNFLGFIGNPESSDLVKKVVRSFREHARLPSEGAAAPASIPGVDWSDQRAFWALGIPAVMVTDSAPFRNPHYHEPTDTPETLDYDALARATLGLVEVTIDLARASAS
jgi:hypothetical protein